MKTNGSYFKTLMSVLELVQPQLDGLDELLKEKTAPQEFTESKMTGHVY